MRRSLQAFAAVTSIALVAVFVFTLAPVLQPESSEPVSPPWIGEALWNDRSTDVMIQGFILLAGALSIVLLLRGEPEGGSDG